MLWQWFTETGIFSWIKKGCLAFCRRSSKYNITPSSQLVLLLTMFWDTLYLKWWWFDKELWYHLLKYYISIYSIIITNKLKFSSNSRRNLNVVVFFPQLTIEMVLYTAQGFQKRIGNSYFLIFFNTLCNRELVYFCAKSLNKPLK